MAKKTQILDLLAKELGYNDTKELKQKLSSRGSLKTRLESGQGFGEAISGRAGEFKEEYLTKEGLKKKAVGLGKDFYRSLFKGDDIFSAYMRGRLVKKTSDKAVGENTGSTGSESGKPESVGNSSTVFLKIIAKESMSLPGMARDTNVLRQNLQKLVKLWGGEKATKADAHWLKTSQRTEKLEVESEKERAKDLEFFQKEDEREAALENKEPKPTVIVQQGEDSTKPEKGPGGGLLDSILGFFKNGLMKGIMSIFNPMAILKLLGKVFVIATILISLFKGITAAFDKWKETGSLKDAIIAGLGAIVDFLTFGFFGEDSVKKLFDTVSDFMDPVIETVSNVISDIKNWIGENIGIPKISFPLPNWMQKLGAPKEFTIGPFYPFKSLASKSSTKEESKDDKKTQGDKSLNKEKTETKDSDSKNTSPSKVAGEQKSASSSTTSPQKIKLPDGWQIDPTTGYYIFPRAYKLIGDVRLDPEKTTQADIDKINQEFLDKEKEQNDNLNAIGKENAKAWGVKPSTGTESSGGGSVSSSSSGGGSSTPSSSGGSSAPSSESITPKMSGSELSTASSNVAEKQRMESAADVGSTVNAPVNNENRGMTKGKESKIPEVYNDDFINFYVTT